MFDSHHPPVPEILYIRIFWKFWGGGAGFFKITFCMYAGCNMTHIVKDKRKLNRIIKITQSHITFL